MSETSINIGFIILAVIGLYLLILFFIAPYRRLKANYKKALDENRRLVDEVFDVRKANYNLRCEIVELENNNKDKDLEDWILKERFIKDLDETKAKADDFAGQLEMQSTEMDSQSFQKKYLTR
jgi:hypothetical protein